MDSQVIIAYIFGTASALIGALVGPFLLEVSKRRMDRAQRRQLAQQEPYIQFAASVERMRRIFDQMTSGANIKLSEYYEHFGAMDEARIKIDLVGSRSARVWAYRCRLSISSMLGAIDDPESRTHFRSKLHEATSAFVTHARSEIGLVGDKTLSEVSKFEDSSAGHEAWLDKETELPLAVTIATRDFAKWKWSEETD